MTEGKLVKDIMHRGVITCKTTTLVEEVIRVVADTDVHAIIVEQDGQVVGIISHMDILRLYGKDRKGITAGQIMTDHVHDVTPDTQVSAAVELILEHNIHRVLVIEETPQGKRPVGVLSTTDVIRKMHSSKWVWYMG